MLGSLFVALFATVAAEAGALDDNLNGLNFLAKRALGPISTSNPNTLSGGTVANTKSPPVSSFFSGLNAPYPTNGWWAPYAATPGNQTAAGPFPYQSLLNGNGVVFGVSAKRDFDGTSIHQRTQQDWQASFQEQDGQFVNHKAIKYDEQTITVQYFKGASTMNAYLVPGSPYMTFQYSGATPLLTSMNGGIKSFNGQTLATGATKTASGTSFTVTDTKGATYLIYSLSTISLTAKSVSTNKGTITAGSAFTGILRLVKLADPSHQQLLDQYSQVYPVSATLASSVSGGKGTLTFTWQTKGSGDLLMLTWPHHRQKMQNPNFPSTSSLAYLTTKGWMYPAIGSQWTLAYQIGGITWQPPRDVDTSCQSTLLQGLKYEIGKLDASNAPVPGDFYYWGGSLAAKSRLALIADHLGHPELVTPVINYLKASFAYWFDSSSKTTPAFETNWGGVVNKAGASDVNVDFGNGYYNDHHFHYGYFLHVAAVIARYDSSWLNQHKDYINYFARDIINPSFSDPYFPVARCVDWFAGHSWASGIANGAGGRDEESTGEAVNGYYGALLWATVALSQDYADWAGLLLAQEIHSSQMYWHLYPDMGVNDRDNPYPEAAARDLISIGNVQDWQSGAWLFWGNQRVEISAIQILPLTPDKEVLFDQKWVENVWAYTANERADSSISDDWKSVIIGAYSNYHPQEAANASALLTGWGSGNTFTNELYFIATRSNPSGKGICSAMPSNPYGNYKLQATSSGKYVAASSSNTNLIASTDANGAATFASAYLPNAGTLQLTSTKQYVTADSGGKSDLAAARGSAGSWETFVIRPKSGASSGVYTIKCSSNGKYVTLGSDGGLVNNGTAESDGTGFNFVSA